MAAGGSSKLFEGKVYVNKLADIISKEIGERVSLTSVMMEYTYPAAYTGSLQFRSSITVEGSAKCIFMSRCCPQQTYLLAKLSPIKYCDRKNVHKEMLLNLFEKEMLVYEVLVPTLVAHQNEEGKEQVDIRFFYNKLFPRCRGMVPSAKEFRSNPAEAILAFEYLTHPFVHVDASIGLDLSEAELVVQKLAVFHSVALTCKIKDPDNYLVVSDIADLDIPEQVYTQKDVKAIMGKVKKIPELNEHRARIQEALTQSLEYVGGTELNKNWFALCHGQLCLFNLMIARQETGQVTDCRLLDLRHLKNGHILSDLAFFLLTSLSEDVLKQHGKALALTYHRRLLCDLIKFEVDLDEYLTYCNTFFSQLKLMLKLELLHSVHQLKFLAAKTEFKDELRTLSMWPLSKDSDISSKIDNVLYSILMVRCLMTVIDTNEFEDIKCPELEEAASTCQQE